MIKSSIIFYISIQQSNLFADDKKRVKFINVSNTLAIKKIRVIYLTLFLILTIELSAPIFDVPSMNAEWVSCRVTKDGATVTYRVSLLIFYLVSEFWMFDARLASKFERRNTAVNLFFFPFFFTFISTIFFSSAKTFSMRFQSRRKNAEIKTRHLNCDCYMKLKFTRQTGRKIRTK